MDKILGLSSFRATGDAAKFGRDRISSLTLH
jgi:hypothetical protein